MSMSGIALSVLEPRDKAISGRWRLQSPPSYTRDIKAMRKVYASEHLNDSGNINLFFNNCDLVSYSCTYKATKYCSVFSTPSTANIKHYSNK